jgi:hypothetical protein
MDVEAQILKHLPRDARSSISLIAPTTGAITSYLLLLSKPGISAIYDLVLRRNLPT